MRIVEPRIVSSDKFSDFLIVDMSSSTVNEYNSFPKFLDFDDGTGVQKYQRTGWNEDGMYLCYRILPFPDTSVIRSDPYEFQCPILNNA